MLMEDVKRYVQRQRDLGFKFRTQHGLLRNFAAFAEARGESLILTQTVVDWAKGAPSPEQRRDRLLTVRRFALEMNVEDERHQIPAAGIFGNLSFKRRIRHIFSAEEIIALISEAKQLSPIGSIRPLTFSTLFGLLASKGLRSSEALALTFDDIIPDGLLVRETKFRKSRLVPLHETTHCALDRYLVQRRKHPTNSERVFVSSHGKGLSYVRFMLYR
jgi:integrase